MRNTRKKGRGIFAKKGIKAGVVLGDYIGKVIHPHEEETYEKGDDLFLMYYHRKATVYPDVKSPGVHIINHSCKPNCGIYTYKGHTLYFTLKKIKKGEELTVSYMLSPKDRDCNPCTHACYCQSKICRKTMHLTPKEYKKWNAFEDRIAAKTKRERIRFSTTLPQLSSYPKYLPVNPIYFSL